MEIRRWFNLEDIGRLFGAAGESPAARLLEEIVLYTFPVCGGEVALNRTGDVAGTPGTVFQQVVGAASTTTVDFGAPTLVEYHQVFALTLWHNDAVNRSLFLKLRDASGVEILLARTSAAVASGVNNGLFVAFPKLVIAGGSGVFLRGESDAIGVGNQLVFARLVSTIPAGVRSI